MIEGYTKIYGYKKLINSGYIYTFSSDKNIIVSESIFPPD